MVWNEGLLPKQQEAAQHFGSHARLLAGPGTGKTLTLTKRICYLIEERGIKQSEITALTFTRAAAYELRQRVENEIGKERLPKICTLHSFALSQLLHNQKVIDLPKPLRIADDWEERNIIIEDIKSLLNLAHVNKVKELLHLLSADWQRLNAEKEDWEKRFPDPKFISAWAEHRNIHGYLLRSELLYILKRSIEQEANFKLESPPRYLLIDEYQDLNRCDLAIIKTLSQDGAEVFVAGDDDQSIYGFRMAAPEGIRLFSSEYSNTKELHLDLCKRCDEEILNLSLFIAKQDFRRLEKPLNAEEGRKGAEIAILRFRDQVHEASGVALLCKYLLNKKGLKAEDILILLRSDNKKVFSKIIEETLLTNDILVSVSGSSLAPEVEEAFHQVISLFRLIINKNDTLAWKALLKVQKNNIGSATLNDIYNLAKTKHIRFSDALFLIQNNPETLKAKGKRVKSEIDKIQALIENYSAEIILENFNLEEFLSKITDQFVIDDDKKAFIIKELNLIISNSKAKSIEDLVKTIETSKEDIEQEIEQGKINILTMHKAKGLTAKAVIIIAAEDQYLPGKLDREDSIEEERRLFYVSLTRAQHYLYISYCSRRTGAQIHTGSSAGDSRRTLTRFLRDAPISPLSADDYLNSK